MLTKYPLVIAILTAILGDYQYLQPLIPALPALPTVLTSILSLLGIGTLSLSDPINKKP